MEYIYRILDRYSHQPWRQHHHSHPNPSPTANEQANFPSEHHPDPCKHTKHKHHRRKMTSFKGPWSHNLDTFKKSVQSMPDQHKSSFNSASKDTLERLCDPDVLHIWETDSDIDNLLQLTSIIAKLCNLGTRKERVANVNDGSMVIIAEEKAGHNNFPRICQLVEYLTGANGKRHLEGTVAAFGSIVVVRGWDNAVRSNGTGRNAEKMVKRINISIERTFKMGKFASGKEKIVWHHGPVLHFLLYWINNTSSTLRSALCALTVNDSLELVDNVRPSTLGRTNIISDLSCLEVYAKKLGIPVIFLDSSSQLITFQYPATYMYYYAYYINTFLPSSLSRPHLHRAQDELVTFAFQLLGASKGKYGENVVKMVKDRLDPGRAKKWATSCIDTKSYEKSKCRAAGKENKIHWAVQMADSPFALFNQGNGLPAFARLAVGPAASGSMEYHTAAPAQIDFKASRFRLSSPATFHILIPAKGQDLEKVTNRIQGLMMAVLERVRQEKGNPVLGDEDKAMWNAVVKACSWAMQESKGKMPKSVEEKVKYVKEKLVKGTWGFAMGVSNNEVTEIDQQRGISDAARANADAVKAYGAGGNQFGQPHMGSMSFAQQQQPMMNRAQQGLTAPPNSPGMGHLHVPMVGQQGMHIPPQYGQSYAVPALGYEQQCRDAEYAQIQGVGGMYLPTQRSRDSGGYPQNMGRAWL
jgi:hypothetical protein